MKILICDDEQYAVKKLVSVITEELPGNEIATFSFPNDAIKGAQEAKELQQEYDLAFLDIEMPEMTGIMLAKELKDISGDIKIVFVTGYADYALEAFSVFAKGYLLKPITKEKLSKVIDELKITYHYEDDKKLRVTAFGNFEVYYGNDIFEFGRGKAKEMFAYLIDRNGASVSSRELASILWPDKPFSSSVKSNISQNIATLIKSFTDVGIEPESILIRKRNSLAVNTDNYFRFLKKEMDGINAYHGEYMTNYEWAEFTLANIETSLNYPE